MITLLPRLIDTRPIDDVAHQVAAALAAAAVRHDKLEVLYTRTWRDELGHTHCPVCGGVLTTRVPWATINRCSCPLVSVAS